MVALDEAEVEAHTAKKSAMTAAAAAAPVEGDGNLDSPASASDGDGEDDGGDEGSLAPDASAKDARKAAKKAAKAARRAKREGRAPATEGQKDCTLCSKGSDLLVRCMVDTSGKWEMVCGRCWTGVSGGVVDGDASHPHYRYGGLWKNRTVKLAAKKGAGAGAGATASASASAGEFENLGQDVGSGDVEEALPPALRALVGSS